MAVKKRVVTKRNSKVSLLDGVVAPDVVVQIESSSFFCSQLHLGVFEALCHQQCTTSSFHVVILIQLEAVFDDFLSIQKDSIEINLLDKRTASLPFSLCPKRYSVSYLFVIEKST